MLLSKNVEFSHSSALGSKHQTNRERLVVCYASHLGNPALDHLQCLVCVCRGRGRGGLGTRLMYYYKHLLHTVVLFSTKKTEERVSLI